MNGEYGNKTEASTGNGLTPNEERFIQDILTAPVKFRPKTRGHDMVNAKPEDRPALFLKWKATDAAAGLAGLSALG